MKNRLTLITGTPETKETLHQQLEDILGEYILINSYAVDEAIPERVSDELVIFSSDLIEKEASHLVSNECKRMTAKRTINYQMINQLFEINSGTKVLCVNDAPQMAQETIETLEKIGMTHLAYTPYSPGKKAPSHIKTAITPGEARIVPKSIDQVIDIGVRLIDITTLIAILEHFHLKEKLGWTISNRYTGKIIELSQRLAEVNRQTKLLNQHLQQVVDGVNDGVMAIDRHQRVTVFNPFIEEYSGLSHVHAIGKTLTQLFKEPELLSYMSSPQDEGKYFTMNGYNLMVYRIQWKESDNILFIFKNTDETITMEKAARKQLMKTGYMSKYSFEDIIGKSPEILHTKKIASKLAKTELPVLIQGESGTGKELFAHSIHNQSNRVLEPFLAVNFSALPEDLLESELFGYEEGAFTGAKKGGKKGLFEQADGGTIFLDEIGDSSLKLQARLLRVIQEMELRKIGGTKTIPINVRIIAATNKDLLELIEDGKFREDLYHRLKVLFLPIPPLRKRKIDIPLLVEQFSIENNIPEHKWDHDLIETLTHFNWYGNIRELKNTVSYLSIVADGERITIHDLPGKDYFQTAKIEPESIVDHQLNTKVLTAVKELNDSSKNASRKKITDILSNEGSSLTEQQIRRILENLKKSGYVTIRRGRSGTQITREGVQYIQSSIN
ncbi:sigma-54 interaction domain-containing protein [Halobacillus mangrovi]|uniref:Transcriptional regulator n=1 Tax=Halobacillus mangrovi TaxID=402384 RepID=A0A1W5ZYP7_9BACI|nr:sigma 54-interacting transcriptional regulator [Halobacillus mangrovi]ARI78393.1 transcriptional regulator [Halobacillus mangrovi]